MTELWRATDADVVIRESKWLKLIAGKPSDVTGWIRRCRASMESAPAAAQPTKA